MKYILVSLFIIALQPLGYSQSSTISHVQSKYQPWIKKFNFEFNGFINEGINGDSLLNYVKNIKFTYNKWTKILSSEIFLPLTNNYFISDNSLLKHNSSHIQESKFDRYENALIGDSLVSLNNGEIFDLRINRYTNYLNTQMSIARPYTLTAKWVNNSHFVKPNGDLNDCGIFEIKFKDINSRWFYYNCINSQMIFYGETEGLKGNNKTNAIPTTYNKFSKYIILDGFLVNKFDFNETIELPLLNLTSTPYTERVFGYNDSVVALSVELDPSLLELEYNKTIDLHADTLLNKKEIQKLPNSTLANYFFKKYTNFDIAISDKSQRLDNISNNLLYSPNFILIYNFHTKSIKAVLDRLIFPFTCM
jgi:hypothetical protein